MKLCLLSGTTILQEVSVAAPAAHARRLHSQESLARQEATGVTGEDKHEDICYLRRRRMLF